MYIVLIYKVDCNWSVCIHIGVEDTSIKIRYLLLFSSPKFKRISSRLLNPHRYMFTYATFHDPWAMNHDDHGGQNMMSQMISVYLLHSSILLLFNCSRIIMTRSWLLFDLPEAKVEAASLYKFHISPQFFFFCNSSQHSLAHSETELMPS